MAKTGRPTKLTPALQEKIVEFTRRGNFIETACQAVGISLSTYFDWKRRGEDGEEPFAEFLHAITRAEAEAEDELIRQVLDISGRNDDWRGSAEVLKRRYRARWAERLEHTGKDGGKIELELKFDPRPPEAEEE